MLIYKGKPIAEPGNVDFGSADISGIGDGTVTGAIVAMNNANNLKYATINVVANITDMAGQFIYFDYSELTNAGKNIVSSYLIGIVSGNSSKQIDKFFPIISEKNMVSGVFVKYTAAQTCSISIGVLYTE